MKQGDPNMKRRRKAFDKGVRDGYKHRRGNNPYRHPMLRAIYATGFAKGEAGQAPKPLRAKPAPAQPPVRERSRTFTNTRREAGRPARRWEGWR